MARNYAALPHDYLDEMDILTDEEFGRLCRALLTYSKTGTAPELNGNEKVLLKRVMMQEDRFQESYTDLTETRSKAGKKGASKRWAQNSEDDKAIVSDSKNGKATSANGKNGNTKTKTETETDTLPATAGESNAHPAVAAAYLNRINPSASQSSIEELTAFAAAMGDEVCLRAMDIALDNKLANWRYIRGILRNWQSLGVKCLADIDRLDKKPETQKTGGKKPRNGPLCTDFSAPEGRARLRNDMDALAAMTRGGSG